MFKDIIQEKKDIITIDSFISAITQYKSLDQALTELPETYINYYVQNQKSIDKALKNLDLSESAESPGYAGWSRTDDIVHKTIKYKGELLILTYDPSIGSWSAIPQFRSVVQALKYGKQLIDNK